MIDDDRIVAGVELGGTKCIAVVARANRIIRRQRWATGDEPAGTLSTIADWIKAAFAEHDIAALGIGSFGPLCLDPADPRYGRIINTPKPGWSDADVVGMIGGSVDVPIGFDTDVAGAALAEGRWGASVGCQVHVYLTIGTGIGGGIVVDDKPVHGLTHPEIGHLRVRRAPGDSFGGVCPFHGDCIEGLASGPAIAARAGRAADTLAAGDPIWDLVAGEIAELMAALILSLSPHRIVVGGGVGHGQRALLGKVRKATARILGGYLPAYEAVALERIIVPPALGDDAGVLGTIALALAALDSS